MNGSESYGFSLPCAPETTRLPFRWVECRKTNVVLRGIQMKKLIIALTAWTACMSIANASEGTVKQTEQDALFVVGLIEMELVRNNNTLAVSGEVSGLNPGETYTVWWLVGDEGGDFLVLNASGGIADDAGVLGFGAALQTGTYVGGDTTPRVVFLGGELTNPKTAYVQFDVLAHGPKIPGRVKEQISTLDAGCEPEQFCPGVAFIGFNPPAP